MLPANLRGKLASTVSKFEISAATTALTRVNDNFPGEDYLSGKPFAHGVITKLRDLMIDEVIKDADLRQLIPYRRVLDVEKMRSVFEQAYKTLTTRDPTTTHKRSRSKGVVHATEEGVDADADAWCTDHEHIQNKLRVAKYFSMVRQQRLSIIIANYTLQFDSYMDHTITTGRSLLQGYSDGISTKIRWRRAPLENIIRRWGF